jgi:hypothetical protein
MLIARILGATRELGKPVDWDDEKNGSCGSLPIRDEQVRGANVMVSAWTPTPGELARLNAGAPIYLYVWGTSHPPVAVEVSNIEGE